MNNNKRNWPVRIGIMGLVAAFIAWFTYLTLGLKSSNLYGELGETYPQFPLIVTTVATVIYLSIALLAFFSEQFQNAVNKNSEQTNSTLWGKFPPLAIFTILILVIILAGVIITINLPLYNLSDII